MNIFQFKPVGHGLFYTGQISQRSMQVPHHGSQYNWIETKKLLQYFDAFIISARSNCKKHPDPNVWAELTYSKTRYVKVSTEDTGIIYFVE